MTEKDHKIRINKLEEEIKRNTSSARKISKLSHLCNLLRTSHQDNIGIIIEQVLEILSGTTALYRRADGNGVQKNTWTPTQQPEVLDEATLTEIFDNNLQKQSEKHPYIIIEDVSHQFPGLIKEESKNGFASCIGVAVIVQNDIIGSLSLFDIKPRHYSTTDRWVLMTLAKAVAIEEERSLAKRAIQESEERYRTILEDIEEGYYEVDLKGNFVFLSDTFCDIFGYSQKEIIGRSYTEFSTPETAGRAFAIYNSVYSSGFPAKGVPWEVSGKDGSLKYLESSVSLIRSREGSPIGFRGIVRDITERRHLELQLRQAQKMEAIGTLAGGVAHDFNNILSIIIGNTEEALMSGGDLKTINESLNEIEFATMRARDVIQQIKTLSRKQEIEREVVHFAPIVKDSLKLLRASIPKDIKFQLDIVCREDTVLADVTQIHQILINLCTNSAHAMQGAKERSLKVSLANTTMLESNHSALPSGLYVDLRIRDTGSGIAPENINRIFDPYFTTKPVGKGTGMGLAMVHGIVHAYNGEITVESEEGTGTVFTILLPVTKEQPMVPDNSRILKVVGNERILLVDDEVALVHTTKKNLERLGYRVTAVEDPDEALTIFNNTPEQFDLVITDINMPGMTGEKLAESMLATRPDLPLVFCTGHSSMLTETEAKNLGARALIRKPIMLDKMASSIREVLEVEPVSYKFTGLDPSN